MNLNPNKYITELESKIQILERENEALLAKAEENLLLNRAFEEINELNDIDNLLFNTLESISVLLNIQFAGLFNFKNNNFICISSYALFSNLDTVNVNFSVSDAIFKKLNSEETCLIQKSENAFQFNYPNSNFIACEALIITIKSGIINGRYFIFINNNNGTSLREKIPLFEKVVMIISAKLERIYYQVELEKLNKELEQKVELRTHELKKQNEKYILLNDEYKKINKELQISKEKAEESDRLKTAFLQNMSHEIRTPMNAIMGFSSLLVENYCNKENLESFSNIINKRCNDLLDIINDILDISKIESGQLKVNNENCNISELFLELEMFFIEYKKRLGKQHINFILHNYCHPNSNFIITDKVKLKQILINIIGNAFKFTQNGLIECSCKIENNYIQFNISDTGIGIPKGKQNKIFERFSQLHHETIKNIGGTGLGLSIAKGLVNLLGGNIWLQSEENKGTTFYFTIKYNKTKLVPIIPINNKLNLNINFNNKTILIVEDDFYNAQYLKEILTKTGINIIESENGNDAIKIATTQLIDIILMDVRLPDLNGYEVTKKIIQLKPDSLIIAQTAYAAPNENQKAIDCGCIDYISKPTNKQVLLTLLAKYLNFNPKLQE